MVAQELRWLSFLLTNLGEWPCSPPVLFADNRSAVLLCEEPELVGKVKHIQLRYFLLRELHRRGQALIRCVVSEANTEYIFTKALPPFEGANSAVDDIATSCRSPRLANPPGFLPRPSLPPLPPVAVDSGAAGGGATGGVKSVGADAGGAGFGGAESGGAEPTGGHQLQSHPRMTLSPQQLREWVTQCHAEPGGAEPGVPDSGDPPLCYLPCCLHRPPLPAMDSLRVLAFDHEGRRIHFDTWLGDLKLYLLSDSRDSVSLFDHTSGASLAPPETADSATRSQWLTRDATARLAIRNHLPLAECAHFGQHRTAQGLYDTVVARYSSPATAALCRLLLPYLFPELSAFATVEDLVNHLRTSNDRYHAALPTEDHFLALDPTVLTIEILEQHLLAAETSVVPIGAARGTPRTPFFEGCSPSPLAPSCASAAAVDVLSAEDVGAASASGKRCSSKGKGGRGGGGGSGGGGGGSSRGGGRSGGGSCGGSGGGSGGFGGGGGGSCSGGSGSGGGRAGATQRGGSSGGQMQLQQRRSETLSPQQLREWFSQHGASGEFGDEAERPRWAKLLRSGVAIFDLDYDAILAAMYALSVSAEGDCYLCVPPDPCIDAAALGANESALSGTASAEALHTFMLDSGASRCFFRDNTTLTPLSPPVPVRLAEPSRGLVLAHSSTVLPCPAILSGSLSGHHLPSFSTNLVSISALQDVMVTTTTPWGQRVSICTCTWTSRHLATFTRRPWSSLYTLATEPPQVAASAHVSTSGPVAPPCSCRLLSHQTLLWHHCLGHPSLPRLHGMHSRLLVSGLPRSLHPLPPSAASPCLPCVKGRKRAAPHSFSFPPTTAPLQTLHMDVWGPARISGQGSERYFLLVVDEYTRYTTVFPLRSKGEVPDVLIPWIRAVRLQLREWFRQDLLNLRLHSDRGGELSSNLLRDFCCGEGILRSISYLMAVRHATRAASRVNSSWRGPEIYAGAMVAQELRWLTYLLTDLGEPPRSPPVLYVDNKAMLALCREHRLEHITKHIALRYFLARELQQRGQLRLAYVASEANTADIFTKALPPGHHQLFCTMLGFPTFRYAAHHLNLWPRVSMPDTLPTLRWTVNFGDALVFWGSCASVRDTSVDKVSARAIPFVFLGFSPNAPGWQFYHPTSRRVLPSQDVTFDESVPFYRLFPYRSVIV
ncbi:unnamed protein product [Closterium sp. NIES-54]